MRKYKPWIRWSIWIFSSLFALLIVAIVFFYYQIHLIHIDDVLKRHVSVSKDVVGEQVMGLDDSSKANSAALSSLLTSPVDKANEFASKPINTQDALDVAAILLKSGLSMKEVYYLTGQANENLSNEEKLKIRELLLSKLSKVEIEALRAITTPYGKELKILDPNYPIELIGVYDPEERKKILKELQDKKQQIQQTQQQNNKQEVTANGEGSVSVTQDQSSPSGTSQTGPVSTPIASKNPTTDPALVATYETKLDSLKANCQGDINRLVSGVVSAKKENKELTAADLQSMFMKKFVDAESRCDSGFNGIVSDASKDGVSTSVIDGWRQSYRSMKQAGQSSAIGQIQKAFSSN